jgi:hypothetical protein
MKNTLIFTIAIIAAFFGSMLTMNLILIGLIAIGMIVWGAYCGFHFEGKKSLCYAFINTALLAFAFLIPAPIGSVMFLGWFGSLIYFGYKAEV